MAVLEEMGHVAGWRLTERGERLRRLYHEADLLVAATLDAEILAGAEPAVLAGVLSCFIFEPRRARPGHGAYPRRKSATRGALPDRLGQRRVRELAERCERLVELAEHVRGVEEVHHVPRTRRPEAGLSTAVASWVRGAALATVLDVARRDVGEVAPGDLVRVLKQVADLAEQISRAASDPAVADAALSARDAVVRSVVASGGPVVSARSDPPSL
jgi:ATP-dependent RNA helicase HelY